MKRVIALRKQFKAFGRGSIEFLTPENHKVLAFLRSFGDELILVVANLSRFPQYVELDLSAHKGKVPVELVGKTEFPSIKDSPYFLTLGAHIFYWFSLESPDKETETATAPAETPAPILHVKGGPDSLFRKDHRGTLEKILPAYLRTRRWFGGKARRMKWARILETIPLANATAHPHLLLVQADYTEGDPELYSLPVAFASGPEAARMLAEAPGAVIARIAEATRQHVLFDALQDRESCLFLLDTIGHRRRFRGQAGEILGVPTRAFRKIRGESREAPPPAPGKAEQSNSSVIFGDKMILKIFRRVHPGINPDLEIGGYLTVEAAFPHVPPVAGSIQYARAHEEPITLAVLAGFVPNQGDAWQYTLDSLGRFFEQVMAQPADIDIREVPCPGSRTLRRIDEAVPDKVKTLVGSYLLSARKLGERTAEFHLAMASNVGNPSFAPEPFTPFYQRSLYQSMRNLTAQNFSLLRKRIGTLPEALRGQGREVLEMEAKVLKRFQGILDRKITAMRIRIHGDYHLGQVLHTGKEFVLIDFEGEPARSLADRRIKRSPLRDVAGMLRSFHYASYAPLIGEVGGSVRSDDVKSLERWADCWNGWVSPAFLQGYLAVAKDGAFLPHSREELSILLDTYLLEKSIYELGYELNNRPLWSKLPLLGILSLMEAQE
jgi:maltose alpha-D-glucosyltransferase/alpha-amylase